jgi:hypothetical protein
VYGFAVWAAEGREVSKLAGLCACYDLRCLIGRGCSPPSSGAPATRARPTSEPGANATAYKPDSEPLERFIRRKGGINACAARFSLGVWGEVPDLGTPRSETRSAGANAIRDLGLILKVNACVWFVQDVECPLPSIFGLGSF